MGQHQSRNCCLVVCVVSSLVFCQGYESYRLTRGLVLIITFTQTIFHTSVCEENQSLLVS